MRIGIDAHVLGKNVGGVERFVRALVEHLPAETSQHQYIAFVTKQEYAKLKSSGLHMSDFLKYVPLAFSNPLIERLILLPWLVYVHKLDALLVQRLSPWFCGNCRLIATIHDLTPIKFASAYKGLSNILVRQLTRNTIRRASLILTPTNAIKAEIQHYCPENTAPIVAFYNGVDSNRFQIAKVDNEHPLQAGHPYLLTVGAIERRKNIETILNAMTLISNQHLQLVIVGGVRDHDYQKELNEKIVQYGLSSRVVFQGFTKEAELIRLYQHASIFISASRDEGFNIPPLEAMACGTPVICSDIAVHRELFDKAARFYDTLSSADLAKQVDDLLNDKIETQNLINQGYTKVALFTWQCTAKNVAQALQLIE